MNQDLAMLMVVSSVQFPEQIVVLHHEYSTMILNVAQQVTPKDV